MSRTACFKGILLGFALLSMCSCASREYYVNNLYSNDAALRIEAIEALKRDQKTDPMVQKAIIDALGAKDVMLVKTAAHALLGSKPDMPADAVEPLLRLLDHEDRDVVAKAADVLSLYEPVQDRVRSRIEDLLEHKDPFVRVTALRILSGRNIHVFLYMITRAPMADEGSLPKIRKCLDDEDNKVRWNAIVALGRLKDTAEIEKIRAMEDDEDKEVREAVSDYFDLIQK